MDEERITKARQLLEKAKEVAFRTKENEQQMLVEKSEKIAQRFVSAAAVKEEQEKAKLGKLGKHSDEVNLRKTAASQEW